MRIGLVGCGRVGLAITHLLKNNNQIIGVLDTNKGRQRRAARSLSIPEHTSYSQMISDSEVLLIATPDDAIAETYMKMSKHITGNKYIFHFSGILTADIIPRRRNIHRASVHPFATFPEGSGSTTRQHFFMSIEGDPEALRASRKIFSRDNFTLRKIRKEDKPVYHLIGVFSSNLLVGLVASINELANKIGWHRQEITHMVIPMIEETIDNIKTLGLQKSLSGPLRRGDIKVVEKHLRVLQKDKGLLETYRAISRSIVDNLIKSKQKGELSRLLR